MSTPAQAALFEVEPETTAPLRGDASTTFGSNMRLPVHRWFRFSAGFSADWARLVIEENRHQLSGTVFDPFAGSGTTLIAAEDAGIPSVGLEAHPFIHRVAAAKLARSTSPASYRLKIQSIRLLAEGIQPEITHYPKLIRACYEDSVLERLDVLRRALVLCDDDSPASQLAWLTLVGVLRSCSHVGTAQWQYVLPGKSKKTVVAPDKAFEALSQLIHADMTATAVPPSVRSLILNGDARACAGVADASVGLVITSPPYPNNYDYADATRLEMSFLGEVAGWGDLQLKVRQHLVRSCSQHVPERSGDWREIVMRPELLPIRDEIAAVCAELAEVRLGKGGKKTYHLMVACYFHDLALVWLALRRVCAQPSRVCFVIGDSAPYGVYVPVMDWLGRLALAAGFKTTTFEKTRDRNIKWKNRKHRVPLAEGRLWVEG